MLNWEASLSRNNPVRVVESLELHEGQAAADIGSGGGYFTLQFARRVGKTGKVYAVDINPKYLDFIRRQSEREGLDNIVFLLAADNELKLPQAGLDRIFARNVFHHLPEPGGYFCRLKRFLKPYARVAIIEQNPKSRFSFARVFKHYSPPEAILQRMERAGYSLTASFDFLPAQTFTVFEAGPK